MPHPENKSPETQSQQKHKHTAPPLLVAPSRPTSSPGLQVLSIDVGIRNLALCCCSVTQNVGILQCTNSEFVSRVQIHKLDCLDVTSHVDEGICTKNANRIPLLALTRALVRSLNEYMTGTLRDRVPALTHVVIENQPCYKNPHMKSVQIAIFTFFVAFFESIGARGVNICMFQPRDKLKIYAGPPVECNLKSAYGRRKKLSVAYATWMIRTQRPSDEFALNAMMTSRKKDDLADAYLQAIVFLQRLCVSGCCKSPRKKKPKKPRKPKKLQKPKKPKKPKKPIKTLKLKKARNVKKTEKGCGVGRKQSAPRVVVMDCFPEEADLLKGSAPIPGRKD